MNDYIPSKSKITDIVLKQLPPDYVVTKEDAMRKWWYFWRAGSGLRLTDLGAAVFTLANIEAVNCDFKNPSNNVEGWNAMMLKLNKKMPCPYYIFCENSSGGVKIRLYDSKVAMMVTLYDDVFKYIELLKIKT
jgi:hypothetical protein